MSIQQIKSGVIADSAITSAKINSTFALPANVEVTNGIKFPGTQSASGDANTLDDYEEGTWTPVIADATTGGNTGSATITNARYTKIGNLVTIQATLGNINTTGMTSANPFYVRGVPFTSASDSNSVGACFTDSITFQSSRTSVACQVGGSDSWVQFPQFGSAIGDTPTDCGNITSGTADIFFTITYFVA